MRKTFFSNKTMSDETENKSEGTYIEPRPDEITGSD